MEDLLPEIKDDKSSTAKKIKKEEKIYSEPKETLILSEEKPLEESQPPVKVKTREVPEVKAKKAEIKNDLSASDTISRLRKEALESDSTKHAPSGKINMAEIEILSVHKLRRLARSTEGFPIQGREISRANRNELLDHFKKLL
jgi:hypothetical protein